MLVDHILTNFRLFVEASWERIVILAETKPEDESWLDDWFQANWELLVEAWVCSTPSEFLEIYGEGADCNGPSSRVWMPDATPTHRIYCVPRSGRIIEDKLTGMRISTDVLTFGRFVSWDGQKYRSWPPFNGVLLERKNEIFVVNVKDVLFDLRLI